MTPLRRLGLVVHPTRPLEHVLEELSGWAAERCAVGQVRIPGQTREVADPVAWRTATCSSRSAETAPR